MPDTRRTSEIDFVADVILVGTSATANGAQVDWTKDGLVALSVVVWMEDLHGTGSRANSRSVAPDVMLVIDSMAAAGAQKVRPGLKTIVVGKPTFSDPKEMPRLADSSDIRAKVRDELGLMHSDNLMVIGFGGDPADRAEAQLSEILKAMPRWVFKDELVVAWRFHPKHPRAAGMYDEAVAACAVNGIRTVDARAVDMNHLTIAADVCVADWGNTNQLAGLLHGTSVVTMMFPDDPRLADTYPPEGVPPVVATDPRWGVKSINDLTVMVGRSLNVARHDRMNYNQGVRGKAFMSLLEPGAAERAADAIEGLLVPHHGYGALPPSPDMIGMTAEELQKRQGSAEPHSAGEETGCGGCGCSRG